MNPPLFSELAEQDIEDIAYHIALDNPEAAHRVAQAIQETADAIVQNTELGRAVESDLYDNLYVRVCKHFTNYLLFYQVQDEDVFIARVFHGARDLPALLNR